VTEVSGWDVSRIALLSKVELNGNEVPFFDNFIKASYIQQPIQLDVKVLLHTGPQIHGKYFTGHSFLPISDFRLKIADLRFKNEDQAMPLPHGNYVTIR
jgi:hypothetical protein